MSRCYDRLEIAATDYALQKQLLQVPCEMILPNAGVCMKISDAKYLSHEQDRFTVKAQGQLYLRSREAGDAIRMPGGTKSLKKLFIDRKIPANNRSNIPVIVDDNGILGVMGVGANQDRLAHSLPAIEICFEKIDTEDVH